MKSVCVSVSVSVGLSICLSVLVCLSTLEAAKNKMNLQEPIK